MVRGYDLKQREVINISDGRRLGFVYDIEINFENGKVESIVVPGPSRIKNLFGKSGDIVIPWDKIERVGDDIILVSFDVMSK
jgi:sporulation protein, YlmC/YmxH family